MVSLPATLKWQWTPLKAVLISPTAGGMRSAVRKLTLQGSGTLRLTGANRYSGGTEVQGGVLEAGSARAFGVGDLYVGNQGRVRIAALSPVQ
ncbi:autotransporter-associated beta strand repeat-containing protein [Pantoea ananatis]